jgi:membrane protein involved in colicin uptake
MVDVNMLKGGKDYKKLRDSYVIFITKNDYFKRELPLYRVERAVCETGEKFGDGSHIIYVNGSYKGDDAIGKLVHDFRCRKADDMYYRQLADGVRYYKESEGGKGKMCEAVERYAEKKAEERARTVEEYAEKKAAERVRRAEETAEKKAMERVRQAEETAEKKATERVREARETAEKKAAERVRQAEETAEKKAMERVRQAEETAEKKAMERVRRAEETAEKKATERVREAEIASKADMVRNLMKNMHFTITQTFDALEVSEDDRKLIAEKIKKTHEKSSLLQSE